MQTLDLKGFQQSLASAKSIVVLMPENPSLDVVAAATSLSLALGEDGKETTVACSSLMLVEFNRLVGVQKVSDSIENRNLTVSFQDYEATNIERVSYNIEGGRFMLVVSPKSGVTAPNTDQVILGYRGIAADVVILVGAPSRESLGKFAKSEELLGQSKIALINNIPVANFASPLELIDPSASSVCEVVMQVIEGLNLRLNPDVATNLFAGLRVGSDNFQKVTADTFSAASRLLNAGARLESSVSQTSTQANVPGAPAEEAPAEWMEEPRVYKGTTLP